MKYKKVYGQSKITTCPFCDKTAITKNVQEIPVCINHKKAELEDMRCSCGDYLDIMQGKFGAFFNCINCGNINFRKGLEINREKINKTKTNFNLQRTNNSSNNNNNNNNNGYNQNSYYNKNGDDKYKQDKSFNNNNSYKQDKKETIVTSDELDFMY